MKMLIIISALFVPQINFGQHYTFQVFTNYEEFFVGEGQIAEPFQSFLAENGTYNPDITGPWILFEDDPGNYIFPMYVVPEQANALEDLLINSDIIFKYIRYNDETEFVLDRLIFRYHVGFVPEFLGIQNGIAHTDYEPLNILFEDFQVNNYAQTFPTATWPINLAVHHLRCDDCDIFQLAQEMLNIEIIEIAELVGYEMVLNINELEGSSGITLFPNPNNGNFTLQFRNGYFSDAELIIYDALGRKVFKEKLQDQQNTISLKGLESGLYFAQIHSGENKAVKKFIIK
jgi:hypothetical protein